MSISKSACSLSLLLLTISFITASNAYKPAVREKVLLPTLNSLYERQILDSWALQLFHGFTSSTLKWELRKTTNCYNEGENLVVGAYQMLIKYNTRKVDDDFTNFNDLLTLFMKKCNLLDSIPATLLNNYIIN